MTIFWTLWCPSNLATGVLQMACNPCFTLHFEPAVVQYASALIHHPSSTAQEKKVKVAVADGQHTIDIAMPACPYDIRIGITVETPQGAGNSQPAGWEQKRCTHTLDGEGL